ncbi:MAG: hypothetical protein DMG49_11910 [Acidobacteria bacterium]|nr:MAG: hypothetical protein DMG49_11910 [Acidobacteriota bacterium]
MCFWMEYPVPFFQECHVFSDVFVNGSIAWATLQAGSTLSVYFNVSPHGDWSNPDSFSGGQLIATFRRTEGFFTCSGDLNLLNTCSNVISGKLASSADFTFNGKTLNFNRSVALGLTNVTPMIDTSFPGFAAVFVGYDLTIGEDDPAQSAATSPLQENLAATHSPRSMPLESASAWNRTKSASATRTPMLLVR